MMKTVFICLKSAMRRICVKSVDVFQNKHNIRVMFSDWVSG